MISYQLSLAVENTEKQLTCNKNVKLIFRIFTKENNNDNDFIIYYFLDFVLQSLL